MQVRKTSFTIFQNEKTPLQAIKTRSQKSRKIDIFPKGLTHAFSPKMAIFPTCIFQAIQARKMSFTIFQNEKTPFQTIKTKSSKGRKIDIFPKGLTHDFAPKMAIFPTFIFQAMYARKMSFTIVQNEKTRFQTIKTKSSKSRKIGIFSKGLTHAFSPKIAIFPTFIFQEIQGRKMSFTIFQNDKTAFQAIKSRSSKSRKIDIFTNGLPHCFGPKMAIFPTLIFQAIQASKMSFTIFQNEKTPFQTIKTKSSKIEKLTFFQRGNPWFWTKNGHFSNFYFLDNIGQENVFYDILERKNAFRGYNNKKFTKSKN